MNQQQIQAALDAYKAAGDPYPANGYRDGGKQAAWLKRHPEFAAIGEAIEALQPGSAKNGNWAVVNDNGRAVIQWGENGNPWMAALPGILGAVGGVVGGAAGAFAGGSAQAAGGASAAAAGAGAAGSAAAPALNVGALTTAAGGSTVASSGVMSWLGPVLEYGVPIAGSIAGRIIQSRADGAASDREDALLREALEDARKEREIERAREDERQAYGRKFSEEGRDYDRAQRSDYLGRFADYSRGLEPTVGRGDRAGSRMEQLLTGGRRMPMQQPQGNTSGMQGNAGMPASGGMVTLRAPDGSTRPIPASQVDRALQMGAVRA